MKKYNSQGFSLVEIIVAAAALGGLSLVVMNMTKSMSKSSVKYQLDSETNLITNEIVGILSDPAKCSTTLLGKNALNATNILSINGNQYYVLSQPSAPANGYGSAGIKISSYALSATAGEVSDKTSYLIVNYQNKKILAGAPNLTKKIKLYVEVDGAKAITSCHSISAHSPEIWTRGASPDIFYSGNVGIGTTAPLAPLHIMNTTNSSQIKVANSFGFGSLYYGSLGPSFVISNGSYYDGATWKVTNTAASHLNVGVNGFNFHSSTGLTVGGTDPLNIVMTIKNDGKVGIGETTPTAPLHIKRDSTFGETALFTGDNVNVAGIRIANTTSTNGWSLYNAGASGFLGVSAGGFAIDEYGNGPRLTIIPGGNVGIGTSAPNERLVVTNGVTTGKYTTSGWTHVSDQRLKKSIAPLENSLEKIIQLQGVEFKLKYDAKNKKQIGFIAQDVEPVFPEVVLTDNKGIKSMVYSNLVAPLVESVKSIYYLIKNIQSDVAAQNERIDRLENERINRSENERIDRLEKAVTVLEEQNNELRKLNQARNKLD